MIRQRDKDGRFITSSYDRREQNLTVRLTKANKCKLEQIKNRTNLSKGDLVERWIENDCPLSKPMNMKDLEKIKSNILEKFKHKQTHEEESKIYENIERLLSDFIELISGSSPYN